MNFITITNNYVQDWAQAREAGIVSGRRPAKEVLYAAIAAHNEQFSVEPVVEVEPVSEEVFETVVEEVEPAVEVEAIEEVEPVAEVQADISADEDEEALQARLLEMDAQEDAALAEAAAQAKAAKKSRKLPTHEQAQKNAADLAQYQRIVNLKGQLGAKKAAEQLTAEGRPMGGTTVCQICTTYYRVLMASDLIQELFLGGLVTWGELYARSRRIDIAALEAEFSARLPQAC